MSDRGRGTRCTRRKAKRNWTVGSLLTRTFASPCYAVGQRTIVYAQAYQQHLAPGSRAPASPPSEGSTTPPRPLPRLDPAVALCLSKSHRPGTVKLDPIGQSCLSERSLSARQLRRRKASKVGPATLGRRWRHSLDILFRVREVVLATPSLHGSTPTCTCTGSGGRIFTSATRSCRVLTHSKACISQKPDRSSPVADCPVSPYNA